MDPPAALSHRARLLTGLSGIAYAVAGLLFFVAPGWASERFPWRVSPFVAMTIGGWCLGNAAMCWVSVRRWRWAEVRSVLVYLWSFAVLQTAVVVWFLELLRLDTWLTYPYLLALAVGLAAGAWGVADLVRRRPVSESGPPMPGWVRLILIAFALLVGLLSLVAAFRPGVAETRRIFPEELSPFTVRAFGALYLALMIGVLPSVFARTLASTIGYLAGGLWLIALITLAAGVHWWVFDVPGHPGHAIYPGVYVAAGVVASLLLWWTTRRTARERSPTDPARRSARTR